MRCSVLGARGDVGDVQEFIRRLREAAREMGLEAQAFDADLVFGEDHLLAAWEHTERAFARGTNVASDPMVEVLRFASGERQIATALEKLGLKEGKGEMVLFVVGDGDASVLIRELGLREEGTLVHGRIDMLPAFGITLEEMGTVEGHQVFDLVLERVALAEL